MKIGQKWLTIYILLIVAFLAATGRFLLKKSPPPSNSSPSAIQTSIIDKETSENWKTRNEKMRMKIKASLAPFIYTVYKRSIFNDTKRSRITVKTCSFDLTGEMIRKI